MVLDSRMKELLATGPVEKALPNCQPYSAKTDCEKAREEARAMVVVLILGDCGRRGKQRIDDRDARDNRAGQQQCEVEVGMAEGLKRFVIRPDEELKKADIYVCSSM